jgi:DNA-binding NarL/FixJ family response regulator
MKKKVILIEFSPSLLSIRTDILERQNYEVLGVLGSEESWERQLASPGISALILGHGSPWEHRRDLIERLNSINPDTPIVTLLRRSDSPFPQTAFNCPADNPPLWLTTVDRATGRIH